MGKSVEWYMSKGMERKMAEYFAAGRKKITKVVPQDDFSLLLTFDNGEIRQLSCKSFITPDSVFAPFLKLENFKRVYLDEENCVAWDIDPLIDSHEVWNNKVDLCPDCCYVDSKPV